MGVVELRNERGGWGIMWFKKRGGNCWVDDGNFGHAHSFGEMGRE